jgi:hypothetical protein
MYTIRTILGTTLGLTVSGVKHTANGPTSWPSENLDPALAREIDLLMKNKQKLDATANNALISRKISWASATDLKAFRDWLDSKMNEFSVKDNANKEKQYYDILDKLYRESVSVNPVVATPTAPSDLAASVGVSTGTPEAQWISASQGVENAGVVENNQDKVEAVRSTTSTEVKKLSQAVTSLSDLNNDKNIDAALRDVVNEDVLKRAISRITNGGEESKLKEVFQRVTGKEATTFTPTEVADFQTKLRNSLVVIQRLTGGNAGLYGLLAGDLSNYATKIKAIPAVNRTIDIDTVKWLTPETQTLIGSLVTIGALSLTGGVLMMSHSAETVTPESIMKDMDRSKLWKAWDYIKDVLTGRRLSLTFGKDMMSVNEFQDKLVSFAKDVMTDNPETSPAREMYVSAKKMASDLGMWNDKEAIQKATIQAYTQNLGRDNTGTDWTGAIGLFFIGANRDAISTTTLATRYSKFNEAEASLTNRKLTTAELTTAGIKIEKTADGKFKHTIPDTVQFSGDMGPISVSKPIGINLDAVEKVYDLHFSDKGDAKYVLTVTERNPQPTVAAGATLAPAWDINKKQEIGTVRNARESKENLQKNQLATLLYNAVGHSNPKVFGPLLDAIKTRDESQVTAAIRILEKNNYRTLGKMLRADISNYETWTTYMYGTKETRMNDNPTQSGVDKIRTGAVIRAESRLAKASGIMWSTPESRFAVVGKNEKHTSVQASSILGWQEMTSVVFATPLKGKHRIDAFDGSIAMSNKTVDLSGEYKNQVIDSIAKDSGKGGINAQVEKLNTFLKTHNKGSITQQEYVQFLKTGELSSFNSAEWFTLQSEKWTRVIEGRAMVAGNVCMNLMYTIWYPLFEVPPVLPGEKPVQQTLEPVASMDATAMLNGQSVQVGESAIGLNPIAALANKRARDAENKPGTDSSTPGNGGGNNDVPGTTPPTPPPTPGGGGRK